MTVYAATKAFIHSFSLALSCEWKKYGVYVQTLVPDVTATEQTIHSNIIEHLNLKAGLPSDIVNRSLAQLGSERLIVTNIQKLYGLRLLLNALPVKLVLTFAAKMFCFSKKHS